MLSSRTRSLGLLVLATLSLAGCNREGAKGTGAGPAGTGTTGGVGGVGGAAEVLACKGLPANPGGGSGKAPVLAARVFTDITPTMQGFAGVGGKATALRQLHGVIDTAAAEAAGSAAKRCSLGAKWQCVKSQEDDKSKCAQWSTTPAVVCGEKVPDYGAPAAYAAVTETSKLDEVLVRKPVPEKVDPDRPLPPDYLDGAGLTVIVSSGIESGALDAPEGTPATEACRAGASPGCVARALAERAKEGYGVWFTTLHLPFDGSYTANVPVDGKYLATTKSHLEDLKKVASGETTPFLGIEFSAGPQTPLVARGAGMSRFKYKGVRPLVLIALSRDHKKGRAFVRSLEAKLQADPALRPGKMEFKDVFHSVELAPLSFDTFALSAPELPPPASDKEKEARAEFRLTNAAAQEGTGASAVVSCGFKGKSYLVAKVKASPGEIATPSFVVQETKLEGPLGPEKLPAELSTVNELDKGTFRVFLSCAPLAVRDKAWAVDYRLMVKSSVKEQALSGEWFSRLSADNDYAAPESVFGLKQIVTTVLKQSAAREGCAQKLSLQVKRSQ